MTERQFRLGTILSVTLHMPLSYIGDGPGTLVNHMTGRRTVHPLHVPFILTTCHNELMRQLPWLAGIRVPDWIAERQDWAALWAWLDTKERRHGVWHPIASIDGLELPDPTVTVVAPEDIPEGLRELLRHYGFIIDDTPED